MYFIKLEKEENIKYHKLPSRGVGVGIVATGGGRPQEQAQLRGRNVPVWRSETTRNPAMSLPGALSLLHYPIIIIIILVHIRSAPTDL